MRGHSPANEKLHTHFSFQYGQIQISHFGEYKGFIEESVGLDIISLQYTELMKSY